MFKIGKRFISVILLFVLTVSCIGCKIQEEKPEKLKNLEFTVISEECLPEELLSMIQEKKQAEFKMTYSDKEYLYICIGYGEQKTGGYSITVNELYLTKNAIYVDTNLLGPSAAEKKKEVCSYPYIVIRIENRDETVVFQ